MKATSTKRALLTAPRSALTEVLNDVVTRYHYRRNPHFITLCNSSVAGTTISYIVYAGLTNRLRSHHLASRIGELTGREVRIAWIGNSHLMSDGSDLFTDQLFHHAKLHGCNYVSLSLKDVRSGEYQRLAAKHKSRLLVLESRAQWVSLQESIHLVPNSSAVKFEFRNDIYHAANTIIEKLLRPYLSVHIRQTDFVTHTGHARTIPYFEQKIKNAALATPYRGLLVASDDAVHLSTEIESLFERTVIITPTLRRYQFGVAAEAMSHLLALMHGDGFIPSPYSSFSEFVTAGRSGVIRVLR